jgi:hypothetical protein
MTCPTYWGILAVSVLFLLTSLTPPVVAGVIGVSGDYGISPDYGDHQSSFQLADGIVTGGLPVGGYVTTGLVVDVSNFIGESTKVEVRNPPQGAAVDQCWWQISLDPIRDGFPKDVALFRLDREAVLEPNNPQDQTGTITVGATLIGSSITWIDKDIYRMAILQIRFSGIRVSEGEASWDWRDLPTDQADVEHRIRFTLTPVDNDPPARTSPSDNTAPEPSSFILACLGLAGTVTIAARRRLRSPTARG